MTGLVLFGGYGAKAMLEIADRIEGSSLPVQLIFICGKNERLARALGGRPHRMPRFVEGFTKEVPYYMQVSDFFLGKPGPGSISEALAMGLPVIVERNAKTLPQERFNADWVREKGLGLVLRNWRGVAEAVGGLMAAETFVACRGRIAALQNRAVFEVPDLLRSILDSAAGVG